MFALIEQGKGNCEKDRDNCYPKDDAVYRGNQCLIGLGAAHWSVRLGLIQKLSQGAVGEIPGGESDIRQYQKEQSKIWICPFVTRNWFLCKWRWSGPDQSWSHSRLAKGFQELWILNSLTRPWRSTIGFGPLTAECGRCWLE